MFQPCYLHIILLTHALVSTHLLLNLDSSSSSSSSSSSCCCDRLCSHARMLLLQETSVQARGCTPDKKHNHCSCALAHCTQVNLRRLVCSTYDKVCSEEQIRL
jgi:hypothetical protein